MTALDQAFVKAFTRQNTSPLPVSPRAAVPAPKQPQLSSSATAASPARSVPLSATLDGVWAALGRPPRAATGLAKPENAARDAEEAGTMDSDVAITPDSAANTVVPAESAGVLAAERFIDNTRPTSSYCSIVESAVCTPSEPLAPYFTTTTIESVFVSPVKRAIVEPAVAERVVAAAVEPPPPSSDQKLDHPLRETTPTSFILAPTVAVPLQACEEMGTGTSPEAVSTGFARVGTEAVPVFSPPLPPQREFKPGWQVDHFTWPKVCRRLIARAAEELDRLADALLAANAQEHKVLVIGGYRRGEGATTLLLCAARRLAERGIKPVLVDADLRRPRLAKRLCLQPQFGWDETSDAAGKSLDQAIVESTANNVALLPVREPPSESGRPVGDPSRLSGCLEALRNHYDMVLVDLGPLEDVGLGDPARAQDIAQMIDAVVLVHNDRITSQDRLTALAERLATAGITTAGIVENFVPEDSAAMAAS